MVSKAVFDSFAFRGGHAESEIDLQHELDTCFALVVTLFVVLQCVLRAVKRAEWNEFQAVLVDGMRLSTKALAFSNAKCDELLRLVPAQQSTIDDNTEALTFSNNRYDEDLPGRPSEAGVRGDCSE